MGSIMATWAIPCSLSLLLHSAAAFDHLPRTVTGPESPGDRTSFWQDLVRRTLHCDVRRTCVARNVSAASRSALQRDDTLNAHLYT